MSMFANSSSNENSYSPVNEAEELDELVDKIINKCDEFHPFSLFSFLYDIEENKEKISYYGEQGKLENYLIFLGYFKKGYNSIELNERGREIKRNGGHLKSVQLRKEESERKTEKEKLEVKQLKWFAKTKWLPFILSGIAVLVSIGALIVSIINA